MKLNASHGISCRLLTSEDVAVYNYKRICPYIKDNLSDAIQKNITKDVSLRNVFHGTLIWKENSGYALESDPPSFSVQIVSLNNDLVKLTNGSDIYYQEKGPIDPKKVKYVGEQPVINLPETIKSGTPIRLSLARPWDINKDGKKRCYLQLSAVYNEI